jgi:DNA-binding GntR family transcriptional regulator
MGPWNRCAGQPDLLTLLDHVTTMPAVSEPGSSEGGRARTRSRDSTLVIHRALRRAILHGELEAGTWLSQVQLARQFGVSRGPVREALRLLERENLVEAQVNQRARVAPFSIEDLEQLYAARIVTEALGLSVSVPRFSAAELAALAQRLGELERLAGGDVEQWEVVHRRFHLDLVAHAGRRLLQLIEQHLDHSERYRRVYIAHGPRAWSIGAAEHREIVAACAAREAPLAATLLARHLSRTVLTVLTLVAPDHEPAAVRVAVRQVASAVAAATGHPTARAALS